MYEVIAYFHGPKTAWLQRVAGAEIIARERVPFLWLARMRAAQLGATLTEGRCGVIIQHDGVTVHHAEATCTDFVGSEG